MKKNGETITLRKLNLLVEKITNIERSKIRRPTNPNCRTIQNLRSGFHRALKGNVKTSSTKELIAKNIDICRNWIQFQMSPRMHWIYIRTDVVKSISFDVSKDKELRETLNYKSVRPFLKEDNCQKDRKFNFLDDQLNFYDSYQSLELNEGGVHWKIYRCNKP